MRGRSVFSSFRRVAETVPNIRTMISRIRGPHHLRVVSLALAVLVAATSALLAVPADAAGKGVLHVVQGLPGRTLDISVDGKTVAKGVQGAEVVGPLDVAAGQRKVTAKDNGKVVIERVVTVGAESNLDVVIHRPAAPTAAPVITSYANKLTGVPKGKAALRVAHTAAVGPADIRVNGKVLFANVANGESLDVVVPAGTYSVEIVPAGATSPVVLGPLALPVKAGYLTRVFAIGEPSTKTMNVVVTSLKLPSAGSDQPGVVNTGTGGQAAELMDGERSPAGPIAMIALLLVGAAFLSVRKVVRR
jgi:hypothetical protein